MTKTFTNRKVLGRNLEEACDSISLSSVGSEFHSVGDLIAKARSTLVTNRDLGVTSKTPSEWPRGKPGYCLKQYDTSTNPSTLKLILTTV